MEAVVGSVVSLALENLKDQAEIVKQLVDMSKEVKHLQTEHKRLQSSLRDADARLYEDPAIKKCLRQMRSLSYSIQGLLEIYVMEMERKAGKSIQKVLRNFASYPRDALTLKDLLAEIKNTIQDICRVTKEYCELKPGVERRIQEKEESQRQRQTFTWGYAEDLVGMDENDINRLASLLVPADGNCQFVSICGMFGTGKTALASKLVNVVREHFDGCAWIDFIRIVKRKTILEDILKQLHSQSLKEEIVEEEDDFTHLSRIQQKNKCLIVLDGIDSLDALEVVRVAFGSAAKTSKILLTTRMREIAETVAGNGYIHTTRCLTEEDGLKLLKRKAFRETARGDFEEIGKKIVNRCNGLPLAINIIGSILAYREIEAWEHLCCNMKDGLVTEEFEALVSVFNDLPEHLKRCFLYSSFFPENYEIEAEKLYLLWMAEDMIASDDRAAGVEGNMMRIAEEYLKELQLRSLVDVEEEEAPSFRRFKSCSLHGLMRELCLFKGKEEEFVQVVDFCPRDQELHSFSFQSSDWVFRLIINLGNDIKRFPESFIRKTAKYLRCLLIYMDENLQGSLPDLSVFPVLRILDFHNANFQVTKLPRGIPKLKRLRYLSFEGCLLEALPEDICSLPYLQVLDLRVRTELMKIPDILWKLKRLRHLYLPQIFQTLSLCKLRLGSLTELETLKNFNTNLCNVEDLLKLTNLRCLTSNTQGNAEGSVKDLECLVKRMSMATDHVLYCLVDVRAFDCYTEERHSVFRLLLRGRALRSFSIKGFIGKIPSYNTISQRLAEIVLCGSELKEDAIKEFEKLPHLRALVLEDDAFVGKEMVIGAACFLELRRLQLSNLSVLKKLTVEDKALPQLSAFTIRDCAILELKIADNALPKLSAFTVLP